MAFVVKDLHYERDQLFKKMGEPWQLFVYICSFQTEMLTEKTASFSVIRTRIVGVEGEFTDH